jgi:hypothetical protein
VLVLIGKTNADARSLVFNAACLFTAAVMHATPAAPMLFLVGFREDSPPACPVVLDADGQLLGKSWTTTALPVARHIQLFEGRVAGQSLG